MFNQISRQTPCNGCKKRHFNCWGSCEEYAEFKAVNKQIKTAEIKYKSSISNIARSGVQRARA